MPWLEICKRLPPPPIPDDLRGSICGQWLHTEINTGAYEDFMTVFRRNPSWLTDMSCRWNTEIGDWLGVETEVVEEQIERFGGPREVQDLVDAWQVRAIVDSFQGRWIGVSTPDPNQFVSGTLNAIECMEEAEKYVSQLKKWRGFQNRPNTATLLSRVWFWKHNELCLLRHELWQRFHLPYKRLLNVYNEGEMAWQDCWYCHPKLYGRVVNEIGDLWATEWDDGSGSDSDSDSDSDRLSD
jgi:hypothetical protein